MSSKDVIIVGGGISGLSALHFLKQRRPDCNVILYEADDRLGGTIGTDLIDGYSLDRGPNGFLDREPLTLQLCHELGLDEQLERAGANVDNRFILRKNRLQAVPMSPPKFMLSGIMSPMGKMRLMLEPFAKGIPDGVDESIYDFGCRRIGREAADYLIQPMVSGIYGGMAERLSLQSCFPIMREMEQEYGSLFKAMIAKARKAKAAGKKSGGPGGPGGRLTSFKGGLYPIIERFKERYSKSISCGSPVMAIRREHDEYVVELENGRTDRAKVVVIALPANDAAKVVAGLSSSLSRCLESIVYAPISVVCLGYSREAIGSNVDGFGFLVPSREKRKILGSIWTSSIFEERAPSGKVQLRTMVGGDGNRESEDLSDDELVGIVRDELADIMRIKGEPEMVKLYRWEKGIPQFRIGHAGVIESIERELAALGNIYVTGNAYYGIGLNDCVKQSFKVAGAIAN